jgi:hypothetical protein
MHWSSPAGRLLDNVHRLEFICQNFTVDWGEVPVDESTGLRVLKEERERWQREQPPARPQNGLPDEDS